MITVGLPVWHSEEIAWLAMESLCRQQTREEWELIICEEAKYGLGPHFYADYHPRLAKVGCGPITYIEPTTRVPLNRKWIEIVFRADRRSEALILQAADCYSEPERIQRTADLIAEYGWVQQQRGLFYDIGSGKCILYDHAINPFGKTALNMALSMDVARDIQFKDEKWSGVDGWLYKSALKIMPALKTITHDEPRWSKGVDTHGCNNISKSRSQYFARVTPPFRPTSVGLADCVPPDVCDGLQHMRARKAVAV